MSRNAKIYVLATDGYLRCSVRRARRFLGVFLLLGVAATMVAQSSLPTPIATAASPGASGSTYVAYGDSFQSGAGLPWTESDPTVWDWSFADSCDKPINYTPSFWWGSIVGDCDGVSVNSGDCGVSQLAMPWVLARLWGISTASRSDFADLACSGATTGISFGSGKLAFTGDAPDTKTVVCNPTMAESWNKSWNENVPEVSGTPASCQITVNTNPLTPHNSAVGPNTKYVTIDGGGDDLQFSQIAANCISIQASVVNTLFGAGNSSKLLPIGQDFENCNSDISEAQTVLGVNSSWSRPPNSAPSDFERRLMTMYGYIVQNLESHGAAGVHVYVLGYPDMVTLPSLNNVLPNGFCDLESIEDALPPEDNSEVQSDLEAALGGNMLVNFGFSDGDLGSLNYVLDSETKYAVSRVSRLFPGVSINFVDIYSAKNLATANFCTTSASPTEYFLPAYANASSQSSLLGVLGNCSIELLLGGEDTWLACAGLEGVFASFSTYPGAAHPTANFNLLEASDVMSCQDHRNFLQSSYISTILGNVGC